MIIRHDLPSQGYTKIDRKVIEDTDLSDGAVRLYTYLCSLRNGANLTDAYIMKALKLSRQSLHRRKKELKAKNLVLIEQIIPRVYVAYIGHTKCHAETVKKRWEKEDGMLPTDKDGALAWKKEMSDEELLGKF